MISQQPLVLKQNLFVFKILADPNRDWDDYWRLIFKKVTMRDIQDFEEKYRHSEEELQDLKKAYLEFEGDMEKILDSGNL